MRRWSCIAAPGVPVNCPNDVYSMNNAPDFRLLFDSVPAPVVVLAPDSPRFTILAASDAYLRETEKRRDEIVGRPFFEVVPDDPEQPSGAEANSRASFERVLQRRLPDQQALQQHDIRRPESREAGFETRFRSALNTPVLDDSGEVRYIIRRIEDVTEIVRSRRQAEGDEADLETRAREIAMIRREADASREREERYAALFRHSPFALALIRMPEGTLADVNDAFLALLESDRNALLGKSVVESGMLDGDSLSRLLAELQRNGSVRHAEIERGGPAGSRFLSLNLDWVSIGGERVLLASIEDVTERKQAKEALRAIFNSTYDATLLHEADGVIFDANETFLSLYGVNSVEQARALSISDISSSSVPLEQLPDIWSRVLTSGTQFFEWKARRIDDGREFDAEVFLRPIRLYGKEMILANIRDISERKRTQRELQDLTLSLEQRVRERTTALELANRELEAFSYSVSHDLRAPLRGIDGFSRILLERHADKLDAAGQDYLGRIRNAALRMNRLIEDMLRLSRIGRAEIRRTTVDLTEMASSIAIELRQREPERRVEVDIAPALTVNADSGLLRIVLENLLGNAFKFTGKKDEAKIEVGAMEKDGERVYYVRDNGAGFDMTFADKLFSPFQRLHRDTEFAGSGIGLASVQRIIARHGGRIWVEAAEGQGAAFFFTLGE